MMQPPLCFIIVIFNFQCDMQTFSTIHCSLHVIKKSKFDQKTFFTCSLCRSLLAHVLPVFNMDQICQVQNQRLCL